MCLAKNSAPVHMGGDINLIITDICTDILIHTPEIYAICGFYVVGIFVSGSLFCK